MVSLYERWVFNPLMELNLRAPAVKAIRERTLADARGRTLEIGLGTGLNVPHLPASLSRLTAVGPEPTCDDRARRRARDRDLLLEYVEGRAEALPFDEGAFDTVVCTFVLCTVADPDAALAEFRRVLADDGQLLFVEHVPSAHRARRWIQHAIERPHRIFACGCSLVRPTERLIREGPFSVERLSREHAPGVAFPYREMIAGCARPNGAAR